MEYPGDFPGFGDGTVTTGGFIGFKSLVLTAGSETNCSAVTCSSQGVLEWWSTGVLEEQTLRIAQQEIRKTVIF